MKIDLLSQTEDKRYATLWVKAENRVDELELSKLLDAGYDGAKMNISCITTGANSHDVTGKLLPIRLEIDISPSEDIEAIKEKLN